MLTVLWLILCSVFVYTESSHHRNKARAVNLALETVIEFDNKDRAYDLRFIDQVQGFLNKVKYVLKKDQNYRRAGKPALKFSDFIRSTLAIINTYKDVDFEKFLAIFNKEARKFNYRGCKFHELVQNIPFRRYVGKKLDELKEMPLEEVRDRIDELLKMWNEGKLGEHNEQLIDYIDSLYDDDATEKIAIVLNELDLYRRDEKQKSSLDLFDIIKKGMRSLFFDHYSNLKAKQRNDVRLKLETAWIENTKEKSHDLFDSYLATDMNRLVETKFEITTKVRSTFRTSKKEEEVINPRASNKEPAKRSHESHEVDDETTKESNKEKQSTSTSSETEEIKSTTKNKENTALADETSEETPEMTNKKKINHLNLESEEMTTTKKKHRKHSNSVKKDKKIKTHVTTTAVIQSSLEKTANKAKRIKFKSSPENNKTIDDEEEVSSTVTTKNIKKIEKDKIENNNENLEANPKTKKNLLKTKKHSKNKLNNNSNGLSDNNTKNEVQNSAAYIETNRPIVTVKQKKHRRIKTKTTEELRHVVAFRNFELSDQDASDTKVLSSTKDPALATDDVQESSDYENTKRSRKSFTTLASNEGMSIESFDHHKGNVRKNNNDDYFLQKHENVKEVVPGALLNRLSQLEKELKAVKNQITTTTNTEIITEKQTRTIVDNQNPVFDTLAFWKGTSKFIENKNENKDMTTITNKATEKHQTKTSPTTKTTAIYYYEPSIKEDYKVITRNRTATTRTFFEHKTTSGTQKKNTTGRVTKTIKFDSPNFSANVSEDDKLRNKIISDKKIFISVETESELPIVTDAFLVPFNLNNTNIKYEVEVITNAESTDNFMKHNTLNTTDDQKINEMSTTLLQEQRRAMPSLLQDENNDVNDDFDPEDLLDGGNF